MKTIQVSFYVLLSILFLNNPLIAQVTLDFETGSVFTGYNNVRIPGDKGTLFSLKEDLKSDAAIFSRLRASYTLNSRHTISALYAPLKTHSEGTVSYPIYFAGITFPADNRIKGVYKFNSYRLTYRYDFIYKPKVIIGIGFTAKIRDASIELSSIGANAEKTNVGFVPIVNFRLLWKPGNKTGFLLEGDALAAPQGRAEDVLLGMSYLIKENLSVRAGYRFLEGGADNDEVYNFALFHYATVGVSYTFNSNIKQN